MWLTARSCVVTTVTKRLSPIAIAAGRTPSAAAEARVRRARALFSPLEQNGNLCLTEGMSRRPLPPVDRESVIERLRLCREAMIELRAGSPPRSLGRAAADQMIANIDELAWILTGDRDRLVTKGHGRHHSRGPDGD